MRQEATGELHKGHNFGTRQAPNISSRKGSLSLGPLMLLLWRNRTLETRQGTACCSMARVFTPGHIYLLKRCVCSSVGAAQKEVEGKITNCNPSLNLEHTSKKATPCFNFQLSND